MIAEESTSVGSGSDGIQDLEAKRRSVRASTTVSPTPSPRKKGAASSRSASSDHRGHTGPAPVRGSFAEVSDSF